jgi:hypothetical protein
MEAAAGQGQGLIVDGIRSGWIGSRRGAVNHRSAADHGF